MKNKKQKTMLPSKIISALIAGLLGISSMATADVSDNEQQQSRVEEIVVTASKREESIMDVAQSVQYMSGEQLEGSFQTLAEIVQLIPGVSQIGASAETYFNFRGTGANLANDSPVGFYIDGMPYYIVDSPVGPDTEMFDLESIQVLRGPGYFIRSRWAAQSPLPSQTLNSFALACAQARRACMTAATGIPMMSV